MKSADLVLLFAAVAAEDTVTCVDSDASWESSSLELLEATTASCKTECESTIDGGALDYCCASNITDADASIICTLYSKAAAEGDIRAEETAVDGES